jgi:DNA-binding response OmpR family regulator
MLLFFVIIKPTIHPLVMQEKIQILLVEDDANLGFVIQDNLEIHGFGVHLSLDGEQAIATFSHSNFDICIIDVMLPKMDGFEVATFIRERNQEVPIIFLTAKNTKEDRIKGFKLGADDYISKPFSIEELILRLEAILKRSRKDLNTATSQASTPPPQEPVNLCKYVFDFKNLSLSFPEQEAKVLTSKEAELLHLLANNLNQVIEREKILKTVWGDDDYFLGRSMDVFISRLRKYLKNDPQIELSNIHGVGFKLQVKE